jgi:MoaA/NifB/PqqE/SkfB family radical SAM enzyme
MLHEARNVWLGLPWVLREQHGWLVPWYLGAKRRWLTARLDRGRGDGLSRAPLSITCRLTMRCNLRCRMCHCVHAQDETAQRLREVRDMPLELAKRLVDEVAGRGTYLCFSGGEPLLYEPLPEVFAYARERGVMATTATNAQLLEERAEELVERGPRVLSVSLLGPPDVHNETVSVPDAFERLQRGIEAVARAKARRRWTLPVVVINAPMTDLNTGRLLEMAELVDDWPIAALHFQHMWFKPAEALSLQRSAYRGLLDEAAFSEMGDASESTVDPDALADEIAAVIARPRKRPLAIYPSLSRRQIRGYYQEPKASLSPEAALCLWLFTFVHPNGEVSPCEGFNAGNLNEQPFMDIWNGEKLRDFRRTLTQSGSLPICSRCCVFYRRY